MGGVWEAHDQQLDRRVAVKIPDRRLAADPAFVERFRREARSAGRLSHPNVAQVFDYGVADGQPYLVMEFVPGETLAQRLRREGALPSDEARRIGAGVAEALHEAHEAGIVHRDVKPGNIMLTPQDGVKVLDFGIAAAAADGRMTGTGQVLGTPTYMAPEQAAGKGSTRASDVYSLGVVLYEMLAGRPPFDAESPLAVATAHVQRDPEPLERLAPDADEGVIAACRAAMAKDPGERPASAAALAALLRGDATPPEGTAVLGAEGSPTPPPTEQFRPTGTEVLEPAAPADTPTPEPEPARGRRRVAGWLVAVIALAIVGLVLIVLASTLSGGQAPSPAATRRPSTAPATQPSTQPPTTQHTTPPPSPSPSPSTPSPSPGPSSTAPLPSPSISLSIGAGG
jgi:serine/threonine-protein kinase